MARVRRLFCGLLRPRAPSSSSTTTTTASAVAAPPPPSPPPVLLGLRSSRTFILGAICTAVFTDIFLYAVIVPVVPFSLSARAGVAPGDVQSWVSILLAVYGAAMLLASPLAGWYADNTTSRRLPFLAGLVVLAAATLMLCLARSVAVLIVGRLLQGVSATVVWTVGSALLVDTVGQKQVGQEMGYVSISMSLAILIAPLLGGVVYERCGYYAVFYMAFGLIALDIILRLALIEKKIARQWTKEPPADQNGTSGSEREKPTSNGATVEGGVIADTIEDDVACDDEESPSDAQTASQRPSKVPPMFTLLKSRRLLAALWGCFVQASLMTSFDTVVPIFVRDTFHWNSVGAGLVFLAVMVPSFAAPLVGAVADRAGPRWLTVTGFIIAIPFWVLLRLVTRNTIGQKALLCALLALIGISLTLVMGPLMAEMTYTVEAKERKSPGIFGKSGAYAQAYALFVMSFAAGCLVGPIWSGFVNNSAGWGTMSWSLGLFSLAGAVPCFIWTGGLITEKNAKSGEERAIGRHNLPHTSQDDTAV